MGDGNLHSFSLFLRDGIFCSFLMGKGVPPLIRDSIFKFLRKIGGYARLVANSGRQIFKKEKEGMIQTRNELGTYFAASRKWYRESENPLAFQGNKRKVVRNSP